MLTKHPGTSSKSPSGKSLKIRGSQRAKPPSRISKSYVSEFLFQSFNSGNSQPWSGNMRPYFTVSGSRRDRMTAAQSAAASTNLRYGSGSDLQRGGLKTRRLRTRSFRPLVWQKRYVSFFCAGRTPACSSSESPSLAAIGSVKLSEICPRTPSQRGPNKPNDHAP